MKKKLLYYLLFIISIPGFGQDFHWSQYQATPLYINPANTGLFDSEHLRKTIRATVNWRQQWRSIRSDYAAGATPFSTYSFALDGNFSKLPFMGDDVIGLGIAVYKDEAGDLNLSTNQMNLYFAYHKSIQQREDRFISLGMNYGYANKFIDFSKAAYDNQWDGKYYNSAIQSGENSNNFSKGYTDFSTGLSFYNAPQYGTKMRSGIAALHLNRPSQSINAVGTPMYIHWIINHDMVIPAGGKWDILPSILLMKQGPATEVVLFTGFRLDFTKNDYHQFGIGYRLLGNHKTPVNHDAFYLAYKLGVNKWSIGLSYDMNVSTLHDATSTVGAFEIALIYHDNPFKKPKNKHHRPKNKCPDVHPVKGKISR